MLCEQVNLQPGFLKMSPVYEAATECLEDMKRNGIRGVVLPITFCIVTHPAPLCFILVSFRLNHFIV